MSDASELIAQQIAAAGITPGELTPVGSVTKTYVDTQDSTLQVGINSVASLAASAQQTADTAIARAKMDFSGVNDISAITYGDRFYVVGGVGITVSTNPTTKEVTITATGQAAPASHASTHIPGGSDPIQTATTSRYGLAQYVDSTSSSSTILAPTADALRRTYDFAASKMDANRGSNLLPNGSGVMGLNGWAQVVGTDWSTQRGTSTAPAEIYYNAAAPTGLDAYLEMSVAVSPGQTYNLSTEFYAVGLSAGAVFMDVVTAGNFQPLGRLSCSTGDLWERRSLDIAVPAGTTAILVRPAIKVGTAAAKKGFRRIQITTGSGVKAWNDDADGYLLGEMLTKGAGSPEGVLSRSVGALYLRSDGGTNTTLYVKQSGSGNTGWVAK